MEGTVKEVSANKSKEHKIAEHENHLVHAFLEVKTYNPTTGAKESEGFVQKFTPQEFATANANGHFRGYSVDILHDPSGEAKADLTADTEKEKAKAMAELQKANTLLGADLTNTQQSANQFEIDPLKAHKELVALSAEDLQAKYEELFGEKPAKMSKPKLADAIIEKVEQLEEEAKAALSEGATGTGEDQQPDPNGSF